MDSQKVDMFLMSKGKYFPVNRIQYLRERLLEMDSSKEILLSSLSFKDPTIILIISIIVGYLGVDRIFIGNVGLGIIKLLTCGGFGVWTLVDWFLIMDATKESNFELIVPYLN